MIEPDETAVAVFRVKVRPVARQNVGVQIDLHWRVIIAPNQIDKQDACRPHRPEACVPMRSRAVKYEYADRSSPAGIVGRLIRSRQRALPTGFASMSLGRPPAPFCETPTPERVTTHALH